MTHLITEDLDSYQTCQTRGPALVSLLFTFHEVAKLGIAPHTCGDYFHIVVCSLSCLYSHCVQGLANESSNHSYGSLGSSSDKESEVKKKQTDIFAMMTVHLF